MLQKCLRVPHVQRWLWTKHTREGLATERAERGKPTLDFSLQSLFSVSVAGASDLLTATLFKVIESCRTLSFMRRCGTGLMILVTVLTHSECLDNSGVEAAT